MASELCDAVPAFATPLPHFSLQCGSSWEVDLRSDADCNTPGLERCHPRYTLGWRHREVQLWRPGLPLPKAEHAKWPEYIHAYCDVWHRGRIEQVVAAPVEREDVRERARRQRTSSSGATSSQHVVILVLRGLPLTRSSLPLTTRTMARFRQSGRFTSATYSRHVPASASGETTLQALIYGTTQRPLPAWAAKRSLWRAYERWGYVRAFGEARCVSGASRATGHALEGDQPTDHSLLEPACSLDEQLAVALQRVADGEARRGADGHG